MTNTAKLLKTTILLAALCGCSKESPTESHSEKKDESKPLALKVTVRPVASATNCQVATHWSANGQQWLDDGAAPRLDTDEALSEFWDEEGEMMPNPHREAAKVGERAFEITKARPYVVYAMDSERKLGTQSDHGSVGGRIVRRIETTGPSQWRDSVSRKNPQLVLRRNFPGRP